MWIRKINTFCFLDALRMSQRVREFRLADAMTKRVKIETSSLLATQNEIL